MDGLGAVAHAGLGEDVVDVRLDRRLADERACARSAPFERPAAIRASTSASRGVRPSGASRRGAGSGGVRRRRRAGAAWTAGSSTRLAGGGRLRWRARSRCGLRPWSGSRARRPAARCRIDSSSAYVVRTTTCGLGVLGADPAGRLDAVERGMRRSMSTTSGSVPLDQLAPPPRRRPPCRRRSMPGEQTEQHREALAHGGLVVGDDDAQRMRALAAHAGSRTSTCQPSVDRARAAAWPPISAARSRMPAMPYPPPVGASVAPPPDPRLSTRSVTPSV